MAEPFKSIPARLLLKLSLAVYGHRRWFFYPQLVLFLLCVGYTVKELKFLTERSALVGADKEYHRIYQELRKEFPAEDDIVVVVESEDFEKNRQFVERLGARLDPETNLFTGVFYKGDLKKMGRKALLFLPEASLQGLQETLQDYLPFLRQFSRATNLVSLFDLVNRQIANAQRQANAENKSLMKALPALQRIVELATDGLERSGSPPSPGVTALFDRDAEAKGKQYLTFSDGRMYLVNLQAKNKSVTAKAIERLRTFIADTKQEVPGVNVGLTGEPILEHDEMVQSQRDSTLATIISLVVVALIFIYGYHETGRPLKATFCLIIGLGYTMGFTTLTVGHLNILTITFVPILIGLAIDFGVHLITRYEEELRHGRSEKVALEKAMVNTGMGIFTGALTTAMAFFAMAGTGFKGIQEMGIICGGGLIVCLVPMMTLLPVLLLRGHQNIIDHELGPDLERKEKVEVDHRARIENVWLSRPVTVIVVLTLLTAGAAFCGRNVLFDYNLLHMQSAGLPAVVFQDKLIHSSKRSVLFAALATESPEKAMRLTAQLTNLPVVETVESMAPYLSGDQTRKIELLREVKDVARQIHFSPVDPEQVNVRELTQSLWSLYGYLGLVASEVEKEGDWLFTTNDFPNPAGLSQKLRLHEDSVSRFLWDRISVAGRQSLSRTNLASPSLPTVLERELNRVMGDGSIYDRQRFASVPLTPETLGLAARKPHGNEAIHLNRLLLEDAFENDLGWSLHRQVVSLQQAIGVLLNRLRVDDRTHVATKLSDYQQALFSDVRQTFSTIQDQDDSGRLLPADLPAALRNRFIGVTGRLLLQVFPKKDIWNHAEQKEFIDTLRQAVDKRVTGSPVQLLEYTTLLKVSYQEAAVYSLISIAIMVFIHFRRISCVILALIPVVVGAVWLLGFMGAFGIPFNPANIMTLPLIVGIGVTNGIHILNRFAEELHPSILARSTGKAVLVSGLTTVAGFGSLILAQHRGIRSLGLIMAIGVTTCMVVGLTLLPAVLNLLSQRGWAIHKKKKTQRDNAQSTLGREEPRS